MAIPDIFVEWAIRRNTTINSMPIITANINHLLANVSRVGNPEIRNPRIEATI